MSLNYSSNKVMTNKANIKKILIAEDDLANQKVASLYLEKIGYQTTIANNGVEAVEMVEKGEFDLVLMDCRMPLMDGLEATRLIRERGNTTIPIIAMTANINSTDKQSCFDVGMNEFIGKPVNLNELQKSIKILIETFVQER